MTNFRIIPKIELKRSNLVKGIQLEGLRVLGKPISFIMEYEKYKFDEYLIEDIMASLLNYLVDTKLISDIVKNSSTALSVGGGINNLKAADKVFAAGGERVVLCSAIYNNFSLLKKIKNKYGSQSLAVKLEIFAPYDKIEYFTFLNGREVFRVDADTWIDKILNESIGEIHVNLINNDGTGRGVNSKVFNYLRKKIDIPLIYSGGVSSIDHIKILQDLGADGVAIASSFHYALFNKLFRKNKDIDNFFLRDSIEHDIGNFEWLINGYGNNKGANVNLLNINNVKKTFLSGRN